MATLRRAAETIGGGGAVRTVPGTDPTWWRSATFDGHPIPAFLRARDIGAVFRFLKTRGWSRAAIAAATGLTETRVRAVAQGRQRITSVDVLERVADGLDIDRGLVGLAYLTPDPPAQSFTGPDLRADDGGGSTGVARADNAMRRRDLIGLAVSTVATDSADALDRLADPHGRRLDHGVVGAHRQVVDVWASQYRLIDPRTTLPVVAAHAIASRRCWRCR